MNEARLNPLILACYQGPLEEELWQSFLKELQSAFNAQYVTLLVRPPSDGDKGVVLNVVAPFIDTYHSYRDHYYSQDPMASLEPNKATLLDEVVDMDELHETDYYRDFLKRVDTEYILGVDFNDTSGFKGSLRITRSSDAENFSDEDKTLLEALIPHLVLSIEHYSRAKKLESHLAAYQSAFDQMDLGCLILSPDMKVLSKNQAANQFIDKKRGLSIINRKLQVGGRSEHKAFVALLDDMLKTRADEGVDEVNAFRIQTTTSIVGVGLLCRVLPPDSTPDATPSVAIFISDPEKPRLSTAKLLEQLFGLTHSEARLALLLANGSSLDEAADLLGVTRNTAKTHLSSAFAKTGVTRQPALVQLILRSVASIG